MFVWTFQGVCQAVVLSIIFLFLAAVLFFYWIENMKSLHASNKEKRRQAQNTKTKEMGIDDAVAMLGAIIDRRGKVPPCAWDDAFLAFKTIVPLLLPREKTAIPQLLDCIIGCNAVGISEQRGAALMYDYMKNIQAQAKVTN